jgi:hypothetical protein
VKKPPLKYKNQIIGYIEDIIYENGEIRSAYFYLFDTEYYNEVVDNLSRGFAATFDKNPDIKNVDNNTLYEFELEDDLLIVKKLKV